MSGTDHLERVIETSFTLKTQGGTWGVKRIAQDGLQNHMDEATRTGTNFGVEFLVDDTWFPFSQRHTLDSSKIRALRFGDGGDGFSYEWLGVLESTKDDDDNLIGENGEGIKLITGSCLRSETEMEIRSRNWFAVPFVDAREIDGRTVNKISYNVYNSQPDMQGSTTTFRDPSLELVDYVMGQLDKDILGLEGDIETLFDSDGGSILDEEGRVYVKRMHITDSHKDDLLFSYNLMEKVPRDRDSIDQRILHNAVGKVVRQLDDHELITKIIEAGRGDKKYLELDALYVQKEEGGMSVTSPHRVQNKEAWKETFHEMFGEDAILTAADGYHNDTDTAKELDKLARVMGQHKVIDFENRGLVRILNACGIKTSESVSADDYAKLFQGEEYDVEKVKKKLLDVSTTVDSRVRKWGAKRIILDSLANHMDSGDTQIEYLVTRDGYFGTTWIKREDKKSNHKIKGVKFTDKGPGFVPQFLELFYSSRIGDSGVGQNGEGLKLYSAAFLKACDKHPDMELKLRSRDWAAIPFFSDVKVKDEIDTRQLHYRVVEGLEEQEGSTTTIYNPSPELISVLSTLESLVLPFNPDYKPYHENEHGSVFEIQRTEEKPDWNNILLTVLREASKLITVSDPDSKIPELCDGLTSTFETTDLKDLLEGIEKEIIDANRLEYSRCQIRPNVRTGRYSRPLPHGSPNWIEPLRRLKHVVADLSPENSEIHGIVDEEVVIKNPTYQVKNGSVFVKGFHITDNLSDRLLFSYDLNTEEISAERDLLDPDDARDVIRKIVADCDNPNVVRKIIGSAEGMFMSMYFEHSKIELDDSNKNVAEVYKKTFYELFGDNAILGTQNQFLDLVAEHIGYKPVNIGGGVYGTLRGAGILTANQVVSDGLDYEEVPVDELTPEERKVFDQYETINKILLLDDSGPPIIYSDLFTKDGRELEHPGFFDIKTRKHHIRRDNLADLAKYVKAYNHEKAHEVTKAADPEPRMREFFEGHLSRYVIASVTGQIIPTSKVRELQEESQKRISDQEETIQAQAGYGIIARDRKIRIGELEGEVAGYQSLIAEQEARIKELEGKK